MITKKCQKMPKMPKNSLICYANEKTHKKRLLDHKRKNDKK
jgi:hypothetical protein